MKEDVPAYRYLQTREGMTCGIVPQGGEATGKLDSGNK